MSENRDNSDRLTVDFHSIDAGNYTRLTKAVISNFGLAPASSQTIGLDEVFQDFKVGSEVVGLEWDHWSGYIVTAKTKSAESLVREIANYISANFKS